MMAAWTGDVPRGRSRINAAIPFGWRKNRLRQDNQVGIAEFEHFGHVTHGGNISDGVFQEVRRRRNNLSGGWIERVAGGHCDMVETATSFDKEIQYHRPTEHGNRPIGTHYVFCSDNRHHATCYVYFES